MKILAQGQVNVDIIYLSGENFTCPKGQIMHKQGSPYCVGTKCKFFEHGMKLIENTDQLASEEVTMIRTCTVFQTTCDIKIINLIKSS